MVISLRAMRYLTVALDFGSISAAARHLSVSASAVSSAIDQVEDHFDLQLTNRLRARGISATADGKVMEQKFRTLLDDYETILKDGVALRQSFRGDLRIGYYAPVAPAFLPKILSTLMQPENDLNVYLEERNNTAVLQGLRQGVYDAILCIAEGAEPGLSFDPLITAPAYCLLSETHPLAERKSISIQDLAREDMISLNRPMVADYYAELFEVGGYTPRFIAYCNSTEMVRSLVGSGRGCALLNMLPMTKLSYTGDGLVARPISDSLPPLTLSVGYRTPRPRRVVREFVDRCRSYFGDASALICQ